MVAELREEQNMKRAILTAVCVLLAPALALAAGYTANLSGDAGTGVAVISVSGSSISYNILVSGLGSPDRASLSDGAMTVDLNPSFTNGAAAGSVSNADAAAAIDSDPSAWTVTVGNGSASLTGALMGGGGGTEPEGVVLYHPVVARLTGLAGTNYVTDVRILNRSGDTATVTVDFYQVGGAHTSPTATATVTVADGQQLVVDDVLQSVFNLGDTRGGVVISSDRAISAAARIYNDQRTGGEGTFAQFQQGLPLSHGWAAGTVYFLSNDDANSGQGYRSNVGWFNPNDSAVSVTFTAYDADGTMLGTATRNAGAMEHAQVNLGQLIPALATYGDCYITYSTAGGEHLFVYGSVVDNVNGDASYVAATP